MIAVDMMLIFAANNADTLIAKSHSHATHAMTAQIISPCRLLYHDLSGNMIINCLNTFSGTAAASPPSSVYRIIIAAIVSAAGRASFVSQSRTP